MYISHFAQIIIWSLAARDRLLTNEGLQVCGSHLRSTCFRARLHASWHACSVNYTVDWNVAMRVLVHVMCT
jgi:hypothetical protein